MEVIALGNITGQAYTKHSVQYVDMILMKDNLMLQLPTHHAMPTHVCPVSPRNVMTLTMTVISSVYVSLALLEKHAIRVSKNNICFLRHTTTLLSLFAHYILSRKWRFIVGEVQINYYGRSIVLYVETLGTLYS